MYKQHTFTSSPQTKLNPMAKVFTVGIFLLIKHIAEACSADEILCVGPQFLAQASDVDIYSTVCDDDSHPDGIHQMLSRENLPAVLQKQMEQGEFRRGEAHSIAALILSMMSR